MPAILGTDYYVIQYIPTGELMPEVHSGYTHWKPWDQENSRTAFTPRLMFTEREAKAVLSSYLQGEYYFKPLPADPGDGRAKRNKTAHHNRSDFAIIHILLREIDYANNTN